MGCTGVYQMCVLQERSHCLTFNVLSEVCQPELKTVQDWTGLKPILAGPGLDRTAIFFKICGSGLDRAEKIFVVLM